jgi:fatty acid synthase
VTIHDHDRLPTGEHTDRSHALVDRLNAGEPYAVAFGGQGASSWLVGLEELATMAGIESELSRIAAEADLLLESVADELVVVRPVGFEPLRWIRALAAGDAVPTTRQLTSAAVSLPGVLLTQIAAIRALTRQGLDFAGAPPVATAGPLRHHVQHRSLPDRSQSSGRRNRCHSPEIGPETPEPSCAALGGGA